MIPDVRDRIDEGINRQRVRLELRRSALPTVWIVLFWILGALILGFIVSHVSKRALHDTYQARFALDDATGVVGNVQDVRFRGIPVGTITKVDTAGDRPVVTVEIQSRYHRLFRDVRAELRPQTALQDMFLDITHRGTPQAGELSEDEIVPATQVQTPVNVSDVLNTFGPTTRARLSALLDDLGNGMEDRGAALRDIFVLATPLVRDAGALAEQLAARKPMVRRLVRNTSVLTRTLGDNRADLRRLVEEGAGTVTALQEGSDGLDATLAELPGTLDRATSGLAATRALLPAADRAVAALDPVVGRLPAALDDLQALGRTATPAVRELEEPVRRLVPFTGTLAPVSRDLDEAIRRLAPQIDTVDKLTKGVAGCKSGIQGFFQWNASISKFGDARGPVPRGNLAAGAQSSAVMNDPNEFAPRSCTPGRIVGGRPAEEKDKH